MLPSGPHIISGQMYQTVLGVRQAVVDFFCLNTATACIKYALLGSLMFVGF